MNGQWADWIAVGLAVAGAATWLGWRVRKNWRKQKDAKNRACACSSGCDGCPFAKGCDGESK
jgi:hypothetical protein